MKKVFILLPDGVGLRSFIYTDFLEHKGTNEVVVWTNLESLKIDTVDILNLPKYEHSVVVETKKRALTQAELQFNAKEFSKEAYMYYIPEDKNYSLKQWVKNSAKNYFVKRAEKSITEIKKLRESYLASIRKGTYYAKCLEELRREKPDFIFCTHQRTMAAVAPILAAKELGIPTGTFIFSWDNLPKGNLAVDADFYFVWSEYMFQELKQYYPWIKDEQIKIMGTPQFLPYTDISTIKSKKEFFQEHSLNVMAKTICFSGDDVTTSPYDEHYLLHTAEAVQRLNQKSSQKYQIIFRRCPTDLSDRYNEILEQYKEFICVLDPKWSSPSDASSWNQIVPLKEDSTLLANTVKHSDVVINVGSTMAIDFALNGKTACYINYNAVENNEWDIHKVYKFIHFSTMDGLDPIYWIASKEKIDEKIELAIADGKNKLPDAQQWAAKITQHPIEDANKCFWNIVNNIMVS